MLGWGDRGLSHDRKSPLFRDVGKRRQFLTIKNVKKSVSHLIPMYSIEYPRITIRKFRVPPTYNGPVIADTWKPYCETSVRTGIVETTTVAFGRCSVVDGEPAHETCFSMALQICPDHERRQRLVYGYLDRLRLPAR